MPQRRAAIDGLHYQPLRPLRHDEQLVIGVLAFGHGEAGIYPP
ncbi:MAG TPA: hypothetical protein VK663_03330 [Burkholderiales bacterium]|nr:hypothetical protein [Burkholderiales bacterium]